MERGVGLVLRTRHKGKVQIDIEFSHCVEQFLQRV